MLATFFCCLVSSIREFGFAQTENRLLSINVSFVRSFRLESRKERLRSGGVRSKRCYHSSNNVEANLGYQVKRIIGYTGSKKKTRNRVTRNIAEYVSGYSLLLAPQGREPVCIRTGSADLGLFFFAISVSLPRSFFEEFDERSIRSSSLLRSPPFPSSSILASLLSREREREGEGEGEWGVPSFSFVRLIPRGSKRKQTLAIDGIRFPSFEENSRRKWRLKYLRRFLVLSVLFPPFQLPSPLKLRSLY